MSTIAAKPELREREFCFIDIETTGTAFGFHEIIDIALIRTAPDGELKDKWSCRVAPRHPERITSYARKLNGFTVDDWKNAVPSGRELWEKVSDFGASSGPVCHNPSFERAFITLAAREAGISELKFDYHSIGTESLAWPVYVSGRIKKLPLRDLCEKFNVPKECPHRADSGADACLRKTNNELAIATGHAGPSIGSICANAKRHSVTAANVRRPMR